jgi:hypothetical protein
LLDPASIGALCTGILPPKARRPVRFWIPCEASSQRDTSNNRDRSLTTTAELLGFSALGAFSRWFRAKFGCGVSEWRAAQLVAPLANLRTGAGKAMS